jgi:hypothetical protein
MYSGIHGPNTPTFLPVDYDCIRWGRFKSIKLWVGAGQNPALASSLRLTFPGVQLVVRTTDLPLPFSDFVNGMVNRWFAEIRSFYHAGVRLFQIGNEPNTDPMQNPWFVQYYVRGIMEGLRARLRAAGMGDARLISPPLSWSPGLWRKSEDVPWELDEWLAAYAFTSGGKMPALLDQFDYVGATCYFQSARQMIDPSFGASFERLQAMSGGKEVVICEYGLSPSPNQTPQELEALRCELYPAYLTWLRGYRVQSAHVFISPGATHDWHDFYVTTPVAQAIGKVG